MRKIKDKSLSVVLPAFNEKDNIEECLNNVYKYLKSRFTKFEIIVVDDGSTDNTASIVSKHQKSKKMIKLVKHGRNRGYGAALTSGFKTAKSDLVFYTDSDNQFNIKDLDKLLPLIKTHDIVAGYRVNRQDPLMRKLIAFVYNVLIKYSLGLIIKDVDCSFKLYKKTIFKKIKLTSQTGLIDAEVLLKAINQGFTVTQIGVSHFPRMKGETIYEMGKRNKIFAFVRPQVIIELLKEIKLLRYQLR